MLLFLLYLFNEMKAAQLYSLFMNAAGIFFHVAGGDRYITEHSRLC